MNCPYCTKEINALTGFQEVQKFQKHLIKYKKNPDRHTYKTTSGKVVFVEYISLRDALEIRAASGQ